MNQPIGSTVSDHDITQSYCEKCGQKCACFTNGNLLMTYNCCIHGEKECEVVEISMKDVVFFRADGKKARNVILKGGIEETTGEVIFYELIGFSGEIGKMLINGKETYKRLFIQRVYPYLQYENIQNYRSK